MKQKGNKKGFTGCAQAYIRKLQEEGRFSTAHVYKNAVLSFTKFCTTPNIAFGQITRDNLRRYGQYLYEHGLKPNTVSVSRYLATVSPTARWVFLRRYFHCESIQEIAVVSGFTRSKVTALLHRTRKGLQVHLRKEGYDP